ncbi:msx2-interacting protein [Pseudophryne corroboree]|uniref:msx2-interacting protein n=1 Tax=Pseudophryne corroboree TaxID=495146 RepID=UPI003081ED7D
MSWTDHAPVSLGVRLSPVRPNSYTWRLNEMIIQDPGCQQQIREAIADYIEVNDTEEISKVVVWEAHKCVIRGKLIQLGAHRKRQHMAAREALLQRIQALELLHKSTMSDENLQSLLMARKELDSLMSHRLKLEARKCRSRYFLWGNKPGKLLARALQAQRAASFISKVKSHTGTTQHTTTEIAAAFRHYYTQLYNLRGPKEADPDLSRKASIAEFLREINFPTLTPEEVESLENPYTLAELEEAVKTTPNGRSPGPDGFSLAYYKTFGDVLLPMMLRAFNQVSDQSSFSPQSMLAHITVIHKEGKDPSHCSSYRPISLLNVDLKLFAKLMANRLKLYLPKLIHSDQVGFVPGREARDNTTKVLDLIHYASTCKSPSILLSTDAEKAFDRVDWDFLLGVLEHMGMGMVGLQRIRALYSDPAARVRINGELSDPFQIRNGTRQGCPLSPLIFVLCMETLARAIRQNINITGLQVGRTEYKLALFADDLLAVISNPLTSIPNLLKEFKRFESSTYYKLCLLLFLDNGSSHYNEKSETTFGRGENPDLSMRSSLDGNIKEVSNFPTFYPITMQYSLREPWNGVVNSTGNNGCLCFFPDTSLKDGLFHEFKKYGKVTSVQIHGVSEERYGLVFFRQQEDQEKALNASKAKLFFGMQIEVTAWVGPETESENEFRPLDERIDEFHPKATRTLFIGNLEKTTTHLDLHNVFQRFGEIVDIDVKKVNGVPQYAFLQYCDITSVCKAIKKMDGEYLGKNRLKLGFGKSMPTNCVWIDGLSSGVTEQYLTRHFSRYGPVLKVVYDRFKGMALVLYSEIEFAQASVKETKGRKIGGNIVKVDFANQESQLAFYGSMESSGQDIRDIYEIISERRGDETRRGSYEFTSTDRTSYYETVRTTGTYPEETRREYPARSREFYPEWDSYQGDYYEQRYFDESREYREYRETYDQDIREYSYRQRERERERFDTDRERDSERRQTERSQSPTHSRRPQSPAGSPAPSERITSDPERRIYSRSSDRSGSCSSVSPSIFDKSDKARAERFIKGEKVEKERTFDSERSDKEKRPLRKEKTEKVDKDKPDRTKRKSKNHSTSSQSSETDQDNDKEPSLEKQKGSSKQLAKEKNDKDSASKNRLELMPCVVLTRVSEKEGKVFDPTGIEKLSKNKSDSESIKSPSSDSKIQMIRLEQPKFEQMKPESVRNKVPKDKLLSSHVEVVDKEGKQKLKKHLKPEPPTEGPITADLDKLEARKRRFADVALKCDRQKLDRRSNPDDDDARVVSSRKQLEPVSSRDLTLLREGNFERKGSRKELLKRELGKNKSERLFIINSPKDGQDQLSVGSSLRHNSDLHFRLGEPVDEPFDSPEITYTKINFVKTLQRHVQLSEDVDKDSLKGDAKMYCNLSREALGLERSENEEKLAIDIDYTQSYRKQMEQSRKLKQQMELEILKSEKFGSPNKEAEEYERRSLVHEVGKPPQDVTDDSPPSKKKKTDHLEYEITKPERNYRSSRQISDESERTSFSPSMRPFPFSEDEYTLGSPRLMPIKEFKESGQVEEKLMFPNLALKDEHYKLITTESTKKEQMTDSAKGKLTIKSPEEEYGKWDCQTKSDGNRVDVSFPSNIIKRESIRKRSRDLEPGEVPSDSDDDSDHKSISPKVSSLLDGSRFSFLLRDGEEKLRDREERLSASLERNKFYSFALDKTITPDTKALLERAKSLSSSREENWSFLDWDSRFANFRSNKDKEKVDSAPRPIPSWYMKKKKIKPDSDGKLDDKKDDHKEEEQEKQELFASRFLHSSIFEQDSKRLQHLDRKDDDTDLGVLRPYGRQLSSDCISNAPDLFQEPVVLFHSRFVELTRMQQKDKEKEQRPKAVEKPEEKESPPKTPDSESKEREVKSFMPVVPPAPQEPAVVFQEKVAAEKSPPPCPPQAAEEKPAEPCEPPEEETKLPIVTTPVILPVHPPIPVETVQNVGEMVEVQPAPPVPEVVTPVEQSSCMDTKPPTPGMSFSEGSADPVTELKIVSPTSSPSKLDKKMEDTVEPLEEATPAFTSTDADTCQKQETAPEVEEPQIPENEVETEPPIAVRNKKAYKGKRSNASDKPATRKSVRIDREKRNRSTSPRGESQKHVDIKSEHERASRSAAKSPSAVTEPEVSEPCLPLSRTRRNVRSVYATTGDNEGQSSTKEPSETPRSTRKRSEKDVTEPPVVVPNTPRRGRPPKVRKKTGGDLSPFKAEAVKQEAEDTECKEPTENAKTIEGWRSPRSQKLSQSHSPVSSNHQSKRSKSESTPQAHECQEDSTEDVNETTEPPVEEDCKPKLGKDELTEVKTDPKAVEPDKCPAEIPATDIPEKKIVLEKAPKSKVGRPKNSKTIPRLKNVEIRLNPDEVKGALRPHDDAEELVVSPVKIKSPQKEDVSPPFVKPAETTFPETPDTDTMKDPKISPEAVQLARQIELEQAVENIEKITETATVPAYKDAQGGEVSEARSEEDGDKPAHQASETELAAAIGSIICDISTDTESFPPAPPYPPTGEAEVPSDSAVVSASAAPAAAAAHPDNLEPETDQTVNVLHANSTPSTQSGTPAPVSSGRSQTVEVKEPKVSLSESADSAREPEPVKEPDILPKQRGRTKANSKRKRRGSKNRDTVDSSQLVHEAVQSKSPKKDQKMPSDEGQKEQPDKVAVLSDPEKQVVDTSMDTVPDTISKDGDDECKDEDMSGTMNLCDSPQPLYIDDVSQSSFKLRSSTENAPVTPPGIPTPSVLSATPGKTAASAPSLSQSGSAVLPDWMVRHEESATISTPPPALPPDTKASDVDTSSSTLRKILMEPKYVSSSSSTPSIVTAAISEPVSASHVEEPVHPQVEAIKPLSEEKSSVPLTNTVVPPAAEAPAFQEKGTIVAPKATSVISRMPHTFDPDDLPRITLAKHSAQPQPAPPCIPSQKIKPRQNTNDSRACMKPTMTVLEERPAETGPSPGLRVNTSQGVMLLSYSGQKTEGPQRISAKISQIPPASAVDIEIQQSVSKTQIKQEPLTPSQILPKGPQTPTGYQPYNASPVISTIKQERSSLEKPESSHITVPNASSQSAAVKVLTQNASPVLMHGQMLPGQMVPAGKKITDVKVESKVLHPTNMSPHHSSLTGKLQPESNHIASGASTPTDRALPHLGIKQEPHSPCTTGHSTSPFGRSCHPSVTASSALTNNASVMLGPGVPVPQYIPSMHPEQTVIMPPHSVTQPVSLGHMSQGDVRINTPPLPSMQYGMRSEALHSPRPMQSQMDVRPQRSSTPQPAAVREMVHPTMSSQHAAEEDIHYHHAVGRGSAHVQSDVLVMQHDYRMSASGMRLDPYSVTQDILPRMIMHSHISAVGDHHQETRQSRTPEGPVKTPPASKTPQPVKEMAKQPEVKLSHSQHTDARMLTGLNLSQPVVVPHGVPLIHPSGSSFHDYRPVYTDIRNYHSATQLSHPPFPSASPIGLQSRSMTPSQDGDHSHVNPPGRSKTPQDAKVSQSSTSEQTHHATINRHSGQMESHIQHLQRSSVDTSQTSYPSPVTISMKPELPSPHQAQKQSVFLSSTSSVLPRTEVQPLPKQDPSQRSVDMVQLLTKYPIVWQGLLALKNDTAAVQLHFVSGNNVLAHRSLPAPEGGPPLRIAQRMRLEATQLEGVARRMMVESDYCLLLALPCGRDQEDVVNQTESLKAAFITYLQAKQAAGIINVPNPGSNQPAYVLQIFPPCEFSESHLSRLAPDLLASISNISPHLMIVIASA